MDATNFSGIDPILGGQLFYLLGMDTVELGDPRKARQIKDILKILDGEDVESQVLKVLRRDHRENKLDAVWAWCQLKQQRKDIISELNPDDFIDEMASEVVANFLSKQSEGVINEHIAQNPETTEALQSTMSRLNNVNKELEFYG